MKNRGTLSFKSFYLVYLGAIGAFIPYINTYLEKYCKLTGSQIGLITAISLVLGVCVIPIWGVIGDKTKKYNLLLKFSLCASLVVLYFYSKQFVYPFIVLSAALLEVTRLGTMPMADTLATNYCHQTNGNYGSIRAMGSLGYMLASMFVGFIGDSMGLDGAMFATYGFLLIVAIGITFTFPKAESKNEAKEIQKGSFKELFIDKNFIYILVLTILMPCVVDAAMNYGGNHLMVTLNASSSAISWMTFMTVLPEVLFLMIALKVINRIGFKSFYLIVAASMILRLATYAFVNNIYVFLIVSVVHCLGVATSTVCSLTYIRNTVNPVVLGTAITLLNAAINLSKALFGYIFGVIYETMGSNMMFALGIIPIILAIVLLLTSKRFEHIDAKKGNIA